MLPLAVVFAGVAVTCAIIYAARTIASAIARQAQNAPANAFLSGSSEKVAQSLASLPVEPSGIPIEMETRLEVGSTVLAFSHGRWWRAEVTALEGEDHVRIRYPGWGPNWDASMRRTALQVDLGTPAEDGSPYGDE
jgi:hypothetical protein